VAPYSSPLSPAPHCRDVHAFKPARRGFSCAGRFGWVCPCDALLDCHACSHLAPAGGRSQHRDTSAPGGTPPWRGSSDRHPRRELRACRWPSLGFARNRATGAASGADRRPHACMHITSGRARRASRERSSTTRSSLSSTTL